MNSINKKIIICLIIIAFASLVPKLYTVDFSIPVHFDNMTYTLDALQYSQGDFFMPQKKNPGWPIFIAPFMTLVNSSDYIDYSNMVRILSLSIATFTIFPMYLLSRKFFNEKFALVAVILFAFEPHLNYVAGQGLSEPLFILAFIVSFLFILNKNPKFAFVAFAIGGIFWWIRIEGFYLFIILLIVYFINFRKSPNTIRNFMICIVIFAIVVSPILMQRYIQFGDPFYIWYNNTLFADNYGTLVTDPTDGSASDYLQNNDIFLFIDRFVVQGISNITTSLAKTMYPYLFIVIPFGILFSLRPIDQEKKYLKSNWVLILVTLITLIIPFSTIPEKRFLFPLLPFLIIFATIPIQRVTEYGLSTFSFSEKKKNYFLIIVILIVIILASLFTCGVGKYGYGKPDTALEQEKIQFAKFIVSNFDGRILSGTISTEYVKYVQITEFPDSFKQYKSPRDRNPYPDTYVPGTLSQKSAYGDSIEELIKDGEKVGLKYISITPEGSYFFPYLEDLFENYNKYPYLKKVFDSNEHGYKKFKVKAFEIDYEKFHKLNK